MKTKTNVKAGPRDVNATALKPIGLTASGSGYGTGMDQVGLKPIGRN